jgi:hypothetical protein
MGAAGPEKPGDGDCGHRDLNPSYRLGKPM